MIDPQILCASEDLQSDRTDQIDGLEDPKIAPIPNAGQTSGNAIS